MVYNEHKNKQRDIKNRPAEFFVHQIGGKSSRDASKVDNWWHNH